MRRHSSGRGGICVLARAVSGRWLHRPDAAHVQDADLSGQAVCAPHRAGTPSCVARAWDGTLEGLDRAADRMCRSDGVLESLAVRLSPAWTRPKAPTSNRTRAVAEPRRRCLPTPVTPRPDPLGWLPGHKPRSEAPVRYARYMFTNTSTDILQIFRDVCDAVGVSHRQMNRKTISVARRDDVARMDAFIGPKS